MKIRLSTNGRPRLSTIPKNDVFENQKRKNRIIHARALPITVLQRAYYVKPIRGYETASCTARATHTQQFENLARQQLSSLLRQLRSPERAAEPRVVSTVLTSATGLQYTHTWNNVIRTQSSLFHEIKIGPAKVSQCRLGSDVYASTRHSLSAETVSASSSEIAGNWSFKNICWRFEKSFGTFSNCYWRLFTIVPILCGNREGTFL